MRSLLKRAAFLLFLPFGFGGLLANNTTTLISESFSGSSTSTLQGRTPSTHAWNPQNSWTADSIFLANGQIHDGTNTDRGAYLDLGPDFAFAPNATYTLTLSWSNLDNAIIFAGFSTSPPNTASQTQTQGTNFALRARRINAGSDTLASWQNPGSSAVTGNTVTTSTGTATLTLQTSNRSNASFTVTGLATPISVDLTQPYRYLWIAYEDPTSTTPASDVRLTSISLTGPAPETPVPPSTVNIVPAEKLIHPGQSITLIASSPDAEIRYTLDGSEPSPSSLLYQSPLVLDTSTLVRAAAFLNGVPGPIASRSYILRQSIGTPNIVILVGENIGFGDLQCYGGVNIATPALDSLADDGIRFTQFTTTGPSSTANQFALLTGRVAARSNLPPSIPRGANGLHAEEWTLAESLRRRGYDTAFIGEWLLGDAAGSHPLDQGFHFFYGVPSAISFNPPLVENHTILSPAFDPSTLLDQLTTRATDYITHRSQPFALILQIPNLPAPGSSLAGPHGHRIEAIDDAMAQILTAIAEKGATDDTLILFMSNNGAPKTANGGSNGLLRDGLDTTWEGGIRTPLLARLPGTLPAGSMNLSLLWLPDLMPTIASLVDGSIANDRPIDGTPQPDAITGSRTRPTGSEMALTFRYQNAAWQLATIRQGKWKTHLSIRNVDPLNTRPTSGNQLYDLHIDAEENLNRAASQPSILNQLQSLATTFSASLPPAGSTDLPAPKPAVTGKISTRLDSPSSVRFAFTRPIDSVDDHYQIEHSQNLTSWSQIPITPFVIQATPTLDHQEEVLLQVPLTPPLFSGNRGFIRLHTRRPANP